MTGSPDEDRTDSGGTSRRALLARAAVVGGVVWSTPLLTSVPAFAQSAGTMAPCANVYAVRMTRGQTHPLFPVRSGSDSEQDTSNPGSADVCDQIRQWVTDHPEVTLHWPGEEHLPALTASDPNLDWAVVLPGGPLPDGGAACQYVVGYGKAGNSCCEAYVDPSPPDPALGQRRIVFPQCGGPQLARVELIYCCP